jgi:hypothetical protein
VETLLPLLHEDPAQAVEAEIPVHFQAKPGLIPAGKRKSLYLLSIKRNY